jgi:hypothetical protein
LAVFAVLVEMLTMLLISCSMLVLAMEAPMAS